MRWEEEVGQGDPSGQGHRVPGATMMMPVKAALDQLHGSRLRQQAPASDRPGAGDRLNPHYECGSGKQTVKKSM